MTFDVKINQLRGIIDNNLRPIINNNFLLLDVPYHGNIGDTMIWQGERDFLSTLPYKMISEGSLSWVPTNNLPSNVVILLHGGGNFGDLYRRAQEFRLKIINKYLNNPIILFPQSVWYENTELIKKDAEIISKHPNLTLCARDIMTYDFFRKYFPTPNILLVPDMAFFINPERLCQYTDVNSDNNELYIRRIDQEILKGTPVTINNAEIRDWPTLETPSLLLKSVYYFNRSLYSLPKFFSKNLMPILNVFCVKYILNRQVELGLNFISNYSKVYTTRLHALIVSILLHKPVEYIDNSTGKLSSFVDTWLRDVDQIRPYIK